MLCILTVCNLYAIAFMQLNIAIDDLQNTLLKYYLDAIYFAIVFSVLFSFF